MYGGSGVAVAVPDEKLCPRTLYKSLPRIQSEKLTIPLIVLIQINHYTPYLILSNSGYRWKGILLVEAGKFNSANHIHSLGRSSLPVG